MIGKLMNKAKSLTGVVGYFEDGSHVSKTPEPETPFMRALQVVDRRDGHAIQLAKTWRSLAALGFVVASLGWMGWAWQANKSSVEWLVVPVDKFGEPGEISTPATFEPSTAMLIDRVEQVVKAIFSISTDNKVNEANYTFIRNTLEGNAIKSWSDWYKEAHEKAPTERVVRIVTIKPTASPKTINVIWTESEFRDGTPVYPIRRINGDFTIEYHKPKTRAEALKNKLSLYVTAMRFAPEDTR